MTASRKVGHFFQMMNPFGRVNDIKISYERILLQKDLHVQYVQRTLISVLAVALLVFASFVALTFYLLRARDQERRRLEGLYEGIIQEKNKIIEELKESPASSNGGGSQQPQHFVYAMPTLPHSN